MTTYQVNAEEIALAATGVSQTADQIRSSVASMMIQLLALQSSWVGSASTSFQDVISRWHATQAQVEEALDSVSLALSQASTTYTEAEGTATSLFVR